MKGQILDADGAARSGLILGDDGNRYRFSGDDWKPGTLPRGGVRVDFVNEGEMAREIFAIPGQPGMEAPIVSAALVTTPGDRSVLWGALGVACLLLSFVVPPFPLIGSLAFGLIGTGIAKKTGNGAGLVLGRISWIGAMIIGVLIVAFLIWATIFAWPLLQLMFYYMMPGGPPAPVI